MTDDQSLPTVPMPADPASNDAGADPQAQASTQVGPQKSPLDILEELLSDARGKSPGSQAGEEPKVPDLSGMADLSSPSGGGKGEPSAEEAAAQAARKQAEEAERQKLMAEQQIEDEQQLAVQRQAMEEIKTTPEYQARVQQEEEKKQQQAQDVANQTGFEIVQLQHKKI